MSKHKYEKELTADQRATVKAAVEKQNHTVEWMFKAYSQNSGVDTITKRGGNNDGIVGLDDLKARMDGWALPPSITQAISQAEAAVSSGATGSTPGGKVNSDSSDGKWEQEGSDSANKANKEGDKIAETSLNYGEKGQRYMAAQVAQIKALQKAIENMKKTPPLRLLVNPNKFSVKGEKIVSDGNWGRNGPIIEHWGDNQDTISGSGVVAGFFAMDTKNANGPGLTRYARNLSEGCSCSAGSCS